MLFLCKLLEGTEIMKIKSSNESHIAHFYLNYRYYLSVVGSSFFQLQTMELHFTPNAVAYFDRDNSKNCSNFVYGSFNKNFLL